MNSKLEEILGKSIDSAKELKQEILNLRNSISTLGTDEQALSDVNTKLNAAQEEYNRLMNAGKQATDFASDSIIGMEKEYKNLYNTYRMLSEEQKNTDFGKNMAESLNTLSEKLNESKKAVGNYKDNIGHYSQGVMDAFSKMGVSVGALEAPMKLATNASNGLGKSLKALAANPIGAAIMAIVVAFKALEAIVGKVREAINKNEESQMALKEAMAAFQPIIDGVANAFDKLGQIVVKVIGKIGEATIAIRRFFASDKEAFDAQQQAYKDLAKAQNDYIKRQREVKTANASDKAKVEELREQASETTDLAEKTRLLTEAKEIQAEIDQRNLELAEENLRILQMESEFTANDAEANDKLAEAEAKVSEARATANANARSYNKQLNTLTNTTKSHTSALDDEKKKLDEVLKRLDDSSKTEIQKLTEKYEEEKKLLEKYHKDTTQLTKEYNDKVTDIETKAAKDKLEIRRAADKKALESAIQRQGTFASYAEAEAKAFEAKWNFEFAEHLYDEQLDKLQQEADKLAGDTYEDYVDKLNELAAPILKKFNEDADWLDAPVESFQEFETLLSNLEASARRLGVEAKEALASYQTAQAVYESKTQTALIDPSLSVFDRAEMEKEIEDNLLQRKIEIKQLELENFTGTEEEKIAIKTEMIDLELEMEERKAERLRELDELQTERNWQVYDSMMSSMDAMNSLLSSYSQLYKAQLENGKLTEKEAKKKKKALENMAKVQQAVGIATVAADTASGIMSVWSAYAKEKIANAQTAAGTGVAAAATLAALNVKSLISAIANTAALATTGAAQIAAIRGNYINQKASLSESSDAGTAAATPAYQIDSTPYSYTRQLQTTEEEDEMNKPIWVSVVDIENAQSKVKVREEESTF